MTDPHNSTVLVLASCHEYGDSLILMRVIAVIETSVQKINADVGNVQHLQYFGEDIVALI